MKIYALTELEEMPKSCNECNLEDYGANGAYYCGMNGYGTEGYNVDRPEWCPLVEHIVDDDKKVRE